MILVDATSFWMGAILMQCVDLCREWINEFALWPHTGQHLMRSPRPSSAFSSRLKGSLLGHFSCRWEAAFRARTEQKPWAKPYSVAQPCKYLLFEVSPKAMASLTTHPTFASSLDKCVGSLAARSWPSKWLTFVMAGLPPNDSSCWCEHPSSSTPKACRSHGGSAEPVAFGVDVA